MAGSAATTAVRVVVALLGPACATAQQPSASSAPSAPTSWLEAGGFYHHVDNDFGSWRGGYARAVLAGARDVWYFDARAQEAFRDKGLYGSLANVHSFGSRFYTQLGVGGGTGDYVLPELRLDGSLHWKLGRTRTILLSGGATHVRSKSVYRDWAGFLGLGWYAAPTTLLELSGRVNWSDPGTVRSARVQGVLTLGRPGRAQWTVRGSVGTEGYQLTGAAVTEREFRSQEAGLQWRQWLSGRFGSVLGAEWYHNPFYTRVGVSLGLFHAW